MHRDGTGLALSLPVTQYAPKFPCLRENTNCPRRSPFLFTLANAWFNDYGQTVLREARDAAGLRVELDSSAEKVGAKIRRWTMQKVPYLLIVGQKEVDSRTVAVRQRGVGEIGAIELEEALERLCVESNSRGAEVAFKPPEKEE